MSRLDELYESQLDGALDGHGQQELTGLLADPGNRLAWARLMAMGGVLGVPAPAARERRPRWPAVAVAAGLAAAMLAAILAVRSGRPAEGLRIAASAAGAVIRRSDGEGPATVGVGVRPGETLRGPAACELPDGSRIELAAASACTPLVGRTGIRLLEGRAAVVAAHRPAGGPPLAVETAQGTAEVRGTRYAVTTGDGRSVVTVDEGVVAFLRGDAAPVLLPAGSGISADDHRAVAFTRPPSRTHLDPGASPAGWSGRTVTGGMRAVFDHEVEGKPGLQLWAAKSPPTALPGLVGFGAGVDVTLCYSLPKATQALVLLQVASAVDGAYRANIQADLVLAAGEGCRRRIPAGLFRSTVAGARLDQGDEMVARVFVMAMDDDHDLTIRSLDLEPTP